MFSEGRMGLTRDWNCNNWRVQRLAVSMSCMSGTSVVSITIRSVWHSYNPSIQFLTPTHECLISDNLEQIDSFGIDLDMICQLGRISVHLIEMNE